MDVGAGETGVDVSTGGAVNEAVGSNSVAVGVISSTVGATVGCGIIVGSLVDMIDGSTVGWGVRVSVGVTAAIVAVGMLVPVAPPNAL